MEIVTTANVSAFCAICSSNENTQELLDASNLSGRAHDWHAERQMVRSPVKRASARKELALSQTMESRQDKAKWANGLT